MKYEGLVREDDAPQRLQHAFDGCAVGEGAPRLGEEYLVRLVVLLDALDDAL